MNAQTEARDLLSTYLRMSAPEGFYSDESLKEIDSIVDLIVDASVEKANANAALWAGDLLAALENIIALVEGEAPSLAEDDHNFEKARDAIARATEHATDPRPAELSRAMGGGDDLMKTLVDICRPVRS